MTCKTCGTNQRGAHSCAVPKKIKSKHHDFVADLLWQIKQAGLPEPEREYKFCTTRKWRFDLAWGRYPDQNIAVEVEGGVWSGGRHTRGSGFMGDIEKYNTATQLGWRVFRIPTSWISNGKGRMHDMGIDVVKQALSGM